MCPCVCVNTYVFISLVKGRVAEFTHFEKHGYSFFPWQFTISKWKFSHTLSMHAWLGLDRCAL